jgi:hypothetical protein
MNHASNGFQINEREGMNHASNGFQINEPAPVRRRRRTTERNQHTVFGRTPIISPTPCGRPGCVSSLFQGRCHVDDHLDNADRAGGLDL